MTKDYSIEICQDNGIVLVTLLPDLCLLEDYKTPLESTSDACILRDKFKVAGSPLVTFQGSYFVAEASLEVYNALILEELVDWVELYSEGVYDMLMRNTYSQLIEDFDMFKLQMFLFTKMKAYVNRCMTQTSDCVSSWEVPTLGGYLRFLESEAKREKDEILEINKNTLFVKSA